MYDENNVTVKKVDILGKNMNLKISVELQVKTHPATLFQYSNLCLIPESILNHHCIWHQFVMQTLSVNGQNGQ